MQTHMRTQNMNIYVHTHTDTQSHSLNLSMFPELSWSHLATVRFKVALDVVTGAELTTFCTLFSVDVLGVEHPQLGPTEQ